MGRPRILPIAGPLAILAATLVLAGCTSAPPVGAKSPQTTTNDNSSPPTTTSPLTATPTTHVPPPTVLGAAPTKPDSPQFAPITAARLLLSTSSASPGTTVTVTATGCPEPTSGYAGFFADSQALGDPQTPEYRHSFAMTATELDAATGTYMVTATDTPGAGLVEVPCGAATNAIAFLVISG